MHPTPFAKAMLMEPARVLNTSMGRSPDLLAIARLNCLVQAKAEGPHAPVASKHTGRYIQPASLHGAEYFLNLASSWVVADSAASAF